MEITRHQEIHVFLQQPERRKRRAADSGARFALSGNVNQDVSGFRVNIVLTDLTTGMQIWADTYRKPDFVNRGSVLIRHFVKFDEVVERLIAGLRRVDIDVV